MSLAHARRPSVAAGATEFRQKRKHPKLHPTTNPSEGTRQRRRRLLELDILLGASPSRLGHLTHQISVSASSLDRKQTSPAASKHIHNSTYTSRASIYSFDAPSVYLFRLICHSIHPFDRVIAPLTPLPSHCFGVNRRVTSLSWHPYHDRYPPVTIKHFNVCPEQSPAFSRINDERSFVRTVSTATAISSQPVPSAAAVPCTIHDR